MSVSIAQVAGQVNVRPLDRCSTISFMDDSFAVDLVDLSVQKVPITSELPVDSAWLFPEYDASQMDLLQYRGVIIERVLERGSEEQLQWLFRTYGEPLVADWVR